MNSAAAERAVTISALVVIVVYGYRRITEAAQPGNLKNILGQGAPVPLGQFVTAWGFTFFVVSILAEVSPGVGGSMAILIAAADLLNNLQPALADVQKQQAGTGTASSSPTSSTTMHVGTAPITSTTRQPNVSSAIGAAGDVAGLAGMAGFS
jgi:hypothetical protein